MADGREGDVGDKHIDQIGKKAKQENGGSAVTIDYDSLPQTSGYCRPGSAWGKRGRSGYTIWVFLAIVRMIILDLQRMTMLIAVVDVGSFILVATVLG